MPLRHLRACFLLCLAVLMGTAPLLAAEPVDAATWGPYARLVDRTQQSEIGYRLHWRWAEPGRKLLEDWYDAYTGELSYTTTIVPGAQPGQLVLQSPKFGNKQWNGVVEPDGSVRYIGVGMLKVPYRVRVDAEGRMAMVMLRIKGDEVTENFTTQYDHADAKGLIPRPVAKPAKMQIDLDDDNRLRMSSGKPDETWTGSIGPDEAVVWTDKQGYSFRMRIDGDEAVMDHVTLKNGEVVKSRSEQRFKGHLVAAAP